MESENRKLEFPLTLDFGKTGESRTFYSADELIQWADNDQALWAAAIDSLAGGNKALPSLMDQRLVQAGVFLKKATQRLKSGETEQESGIWKHIACYADGLTLPADTSLGSYIRKLSTQNRDGALGVLLLSTTIHNEKIFTEVIPRIDQVIEAGHDAIDEYRTESGNKVPFLAPYTNLIKQLSALRRDLEGQNKSIEKIDSKLHETIDTFADCIERAEIALAELPKKIDDEINETSLKLNEAVNHIASLIPQAKKDAQESVEALKEVFRTRQHLKQPIEYWRNKKQEHRDEEKKLIVILIASASGFLAFAGLLGWYFFEILNVGQFHFWTLGFTALYVSMGIWLLRTQLKLFYSTRHLAEDAHEREVMVDGLFSLLSDAKALEATQQGAMSKAVEILYRPSKKGVISDDGPGLDLNKLMEALAAKIK